ncbi:MAG: phage shock protein PspA [Xanthomonadales bacterium]|nr:phage shock protein PspA [Xanthomonadales bacterium]
MSVFSRLSDIINANINTMLEKAEDPEKIIRLMVQEMEDTLVEIRSSAAKCIAEKKDRYRQIRYLEEDFADWAKKAELAVSKDREDLARAALHEKAEISRRIEVLKADLEVVEDQLQKFDQDITLLQNKLTDAKNRQRSIALRQQTAKTQLRTRKHVYNDQLDDLMYRFETAEQRIERVESEAEAMSMGRSSSLAEQIDELQNDDDIRDELDALKARMNKSPAAKKKGKDNA